MIHSCISKLDSMIQAKDLRPGNKVYNQTGEVITIQQILHSTIVYDTQMKVDQEKSNLRHSDVLTYTSKVVEVIKETEYQHLQPIAITPQILEQCGFRHFKREEWFISHGHSHTDFEYTEEGLRLRNPPSCKILIKHLHQLQNFFFAVTGHELTVNL